MDDSKINELIDSSCFIDDKLKDECKKYLKQIPKGLGDLIRNMKYLRI